MEKLKEEKENIETSLWQWQLMNCIVKFKLYFILYTERNDKIVWWQNNKVDRLATSTNTQMIEYKSMNVKYKKSFWVIINSYSYKLS
jgi:hypothetical protein